MTIGILDTGVANVASMVAVFGRLGLEARVCRADDEVDDAVTHIVLPGVGAFSAVERLRERGFDRVVQRAVDSKTPLLAVCLGLQMLCDGSDEAPGVPGLGVIPGQCRALPRDVIVPHLGWNQVTPDAGGLVQTGAAAFANSYALLEAPEGWKTSWSVHGRRFVAAVERDRVLACQFHPELSSWWGAQLIRAWYEGPKRVVLDASRARLTSVPDVRGYKRSKETKEATDALGATKSTETARTTDTIKATETTESTERITRGGSLVGTGTGGPVRGFRGFRGTLASGGFLSRTVESLLVRAPKTNVMSRIIPCLDVRNGRVVKGVQFQDLRDVGDPATIAERYEHDGADEIVVLDIAAAPEGLGHRTQVVHEVRKRVGIPLTVGGGVRSVEDARALLGAGADKTSINTAAVRNPKLVGDMAREFGCQCVVVAIDAKRGDGGWHVRTLGGRESTDLDVVEWADRCVQLGAGEILLTSWDRDGTRSGYDLELIEAVTDRVHVPVIASGGGGNAEDVVTALVTGAHAVLAASIFHDGDMTVRDLKEYLRDRNVSVRL